MTEMNQDFAFDAPQFYDFSNGEYVEESPEKLEEYFNVDHYECEKVIEGYETHIQESMEYQEFFTPMANSPRRFEYHNESDESPEMPQLRRSMSVGNIILSQDMKDEDHTLVCKMDELSVTTNVSAQKGRNSRLTEHLNRLAQPKRLYASTENLQNRERFVSVAEQVSRFQQGTPVRFRTKPAPGAGARPHITKAQSPALTTKLRARPVHVPSREERERRELEEARKFKIRAHPVNKKVMQGPVKAVNCVPKKPATIPQPFKITSYPKKAPALEPTEKYEFHAKPVPKSVMEPANRPKLPQRVTTPQTPSFMKLYNRVTPKKDVDVPDRRCSSAQKTGARPTATKPAPFSFEKRDQDIMRRREELIKKAILQWPSQLQLLDVSPANLNIGPEVPTAIFGETPSNFSCEDHVRIVRKRSALEEEKKAREFHAKPIPKSLYRPPSRENSTTETSRQGSFTNSVRSTKSDDGVHCVPQFRARPAKVLHMKPFVPKRDERPLTEIVAFDLNTDRRRQERAEFDQRQREKEEKIEALRRAEEEMLRLQEAEEAARAREETKFRANPIKHYRELHVQPSGKVTEPVSPHWHTNRLRNKENIAENQ